MFARYWRQSGRTLGPEAAGALRDLKSMGLRTILLTGDLRTVAENVRRKLGVDEIVSELLPEDKLNYVQRLTNAPTPF
jgi:cation transport ATPase